MFYNIGMISDIIKPYIITSLNYHNIRRQRRFRWCDIRYSMLYFYYIQFTHCYILISTVQTFFTDSSPVIHIIPLLFHYQQVNNISTDKTIINLSDIPALAEYFNHNTGTNRIKYCICHPFNIVPDIGYVFIPAYVSVSIISYCNNTCKQWNIIATYTLIKPLPS